MNFKNITKLKKLLESNNPVIITDIPGIKVHLQYIYLFFKNCKISVEKYRYHEFQPIFTDTLTHFLYQGYLPNFSTAVIIGVYIAIVLSVFLVCQSPHFVNISQTAQMFQVIFFACSILSGWEWMIPNFILVWKLWRSFSGGREEESQNIKYLYLMIDFSKIWNNVS